MTFELETKPITIGDKPKMHAENDNRLGSNKPECDLLSSLAIPCSLVKNGYGRQILATILVATWPQPPLCSPLTTSDHV